MNTLAATSDLRRNAVSPLCLAATGAQQREAGSAGQTAGPLEGARPPSAHLLPDGSDAGYPGGLPAEPPVPLPGSRAFQTRFSCVFLSQVSSVRKC